MAKSTYFIMLALLSFLLLYEYSKKPGEHILVSKTWVLSSYGLRDNKKHRLIKGVHYYLNFYDYPDFATLNTSCPFEDSLGNYKISVLGRLFIGDCFVHFAQGCPDNDGSKHYRQEKDFIKGVFLGSKIHIRGNKLFLTSSDEKQLIFTGVTNGERMNYFEQLISGFWVMLHRCREFLHVAKKQPTADKSLPAFYKWAGQS